MSDSYGAVPSIQFGEHDAGSGSAYSPTGPRNPKVGLGGLVPFGDKLLGPCRFRRSASLLGARNDDTDRTSARLAEQEMLRTCCR
jgi:hypothetical protein